MGYSKITVEEKDHILLMGLNRPEKRNAFDLDMYMELADAYGELHRNKELRCGILFGHGEHFTAGLELDKWAAVFQNGKIDIPEGAIHPLGIDEDNRCSKPVVIEHSLTVSNFSSFLRKIRDIPLKSSISRYF